MNNIDFIINDREPVSLEEVFLSEDSRKEIQQLIKEHSYIAELTEYGLEVNHKIMLQGASGCGKTMTAKAVATALGKNILILNLGNIVSSRIGETSQNIKRVFDRAGREKAVLFLDEFDQIGKARGSDETDVGEMRRLVNTVIQLIDYLPNKTMLICATNHPEIIDHALMRRFQVRINYTMPDRATLDTYYDTLLSRFPQQLHTIQRKYDISFAEAKDTCLTQVKTLLIQQLDEQRSLRSTDENEGEK